MTAEAVVDSIEWVRKGDPDVPDVRGEIRDERSGVVRTFVVSGGVDHPYLETVTRFGFTGVEDHYHEGHERVQARITDRTGFEEFDRVNSGSEGSDASTARDLDSIARSLIGARCSRGERRTRTRPSEERNGEPANGDATPR